MSAYFPIRVILATVLVAAGGFVIGRLMWGFVQYAIGG